MPRPSNDELIGREIARRTGVSLDARRERPILFSGPMVRAILDGRKTQTRRAVKPKAWANPANRPLLNRCPYGQPGDRLWVRETFAKKLAHTGRPLGWAYRADGERAEYELGNGHWSPSIHMPRSACRLVIELVAVRIERLQDISGADAEAEGAELNGGAALWPHVNRGDKMIAAYEKLWDSINGKGAWDKNPLVWVIEFEVCA